MSAAKDPLDPISLTPAPEAVPSDEFSRSPLLVLFGLVVVWGSLYLVAIAQSISYTPPPAVLIPATPPAPAFVPPRPGEADPAGSMLAPVDSLNLKEVPARQVVKDLLYKAHLHIEAAELDKVSAEVTDLHFENRPLYECLYSALDDESLGWAVLDNAARLVTQQVTHQFPDSGPLEQFNWETEIDLFPRPVSLFPSGRSDLWLKLRAIPPDPADSAPTRVGFEIFRGAAKEASGEAQIPAPGAGSIRFIPGSRLGLRIENRTAPPVEGAEATGALRVGVRLQVQSLTAEGTGEDLADGA